MKNYKLNLKDNEEMIVDVDDLMEKELKIFKEQIKDLTEAEAKLFDNWIKIYKLLNYDIIEGLTVDKVYKFNETSAVIELTFRGHKEYDFLNLNPETLIVACMSSKENSVRPYLVRRLLIPQTVEDALSFAKAELPGAGIKAVSNTLREIKLHGKRYDVTNEINLESKEFRSLALKAPKQRLALEAPVSRLLLNGPANKLLLNGPANKLLLNSPENKLALEAPKLIVVEIGTTPVVVDLTAKAVVEKDSRKIESMKESEKEIKQQNVQHVNYSNKGVLDSIFSSHNTDGTFNAYKYINNLR